METKKIEIEVPEGKTAKWIDGVLKLVDEDTKDKQPVSERVKTFEDACRKLGDKNPLVMTYNAFIESVEIDDTDADLIAYMKLRIICAALNEGWEPQFTNGECRYYPWIYLYNQEEVDSMDEDERNRLVLWGGFADAGAYCGLASAFSNLDWSSSPARVGSRLCLKSEELAIYCGKQFFEIWSDYYFN